MKRFIVCLLVSLCLTTAGISFAAPKKAAPSKSAAQPQAPAAITGKVVQTMNSGGYTYVQLESGKEKIWVAVTEAKITKGQVVSFKPGAVMEDFESKTLKRKFDRIVFSDGLVTPGGAAAEAKPTGSKDKAVKTKEKIKVEKAEAANAYTVEDLFKNKATLQHKNVTVKGKVVKVSPGIMQRTWVHIQDGTGDAKKGTHNLVTTSTAEPIPVVGDMVTMTGTFFKDKDFGSGYKYDIIVENAIYKKEAQKEQQKK
ncbi:MAG: DNA-binding protein [Nitrospirae bacterium]|nr:MAG: DNA-binding protein [Nitrospirota bacterium]